MSVGIFICLSVCPPLPCVMSNAKAVRDIANNNILCIAALGYLNPELKLVLLTKHIERFMGLPFVAFFNRPGPKAGSIHSIEVSVCVFVCLQSCFYVNMTRRIEEDQEHLKTHMSMILVMFMPIILAMINLII